MQGAINEKLKSARKLPAGLAGDLPRRWTNFHIFEAKCETAGTLAVGISFSLLAIEESLEAKNPSVDHCNAAAAWLAYAAPAILAACRENSPSGWTEPISDERIWKGQNGYSIGRWELWKKRTEELRVGGLLPDETSAMLRQAYVAMGKAEREKAKK
jgi:hypothetical protein